MRVKYPISALFVLVFHVLMVGCSYRPSMADMDKCENITDFYRLISVNEPTGGVNPGVMLSDAQVSMLYNITSYSRSWPEGFDSIRVVTIDANARKYYLCIDRKDRICSVEWDDCGGTTAIERVLADKAGWYCPGHLVSLDLSGNRLNVHGGKYEGFRTGSRGILVLDGVDVAVGKIEQMSSVLVTVVIDDAGVKALSELGKESLSRITLRSE